MMAYGQVLLDLIKAFERIPHALLAREAARFGYPLWLLRLSLAAYRLPRTLRIGEVYSGLVLACRGVTAGSGNATTEMKIMMINIVDGALKVYPHIEPTLFVDDLSAERTAGEEVMLKDVIGFTMHVSKAIVDSEMELSDVKCVCNASTDAMGRKLEAGLARLNIAYRKKVKSLGAGLAGGRRRNTDVQKARLKNFKARVKKFRMLAKVGVKVHRLLRTGAIKSMTYGQAIMGVTDSMLRNLRRTTGAASSTAGGPGGQNLDIQLMAADDGPKGKADPAFDSHELPIGQWALAMWESWLPQVTMMKMVAAKLPILIRAPRPWSRVYGPAAAFIQAKVDGG